MPWTCRNRTAFLCTTRRFRTRRGAPQHRVCYLCNDAEDSLEHLACCPTVRRLFAAHSHPQPSERSRATEHFFGLDKDSFPSRTVLVAKLVAVVFTVHRSLRNLGNSENIEVEVWTLVQVACSHVLGVAHRPANLSERNPI